MDSRGQTLIALLMFMLVTIVITTTAAAIAVVNLQAGNSYSSGEIAVQNAETGIENAFLQLLRNPSYTGETMTLTEGAATITISGTTTKTIVSIGSSGNFRRTVTATAANSNNVLTLSSWRETP